MEKEFASNKEKFEYGVLLYRYGLTMREIEEFVGINRKSLSSYFKKNDLKFRNKNEFIEEELIRYKNENNFIYLVVDKNNPYIKINDSNNFGGYISNYLENVYYVIFNKIK